MKILFFGDVNSIHDRKWVDYFFSKVHLSYAFVNEGEIPLSKNSSGIENTCPFKIPEFTFTNPFSYLIGVWRLRKWARKNGFDLGHVFIGTSHTITMWLLGIPYIITTRGTDMNETLPSIYKSKQLKNRILFALMKRAFLKANRITSTSHSQIESLKKIIPSLEPVLVRSGVEVQSILSTVSRDSRFEGRKILFPRGLTNVYDPNLSLNAIGMLGNKVLEKYQFIFLYADNQRDIKETLEAKFSHLRISIHFEPFMKKEYLWELMHECELVVMNPLHDGTPNSALETMLIGTKLILGACDYDDGLFDAPSIWRMKTHTAEELAKIMLVAIEKDVELDTAKTIVEEKASQEVEMGKVLDIYEEIISGH